jgi:UMF1 family MFS transporter
MATNFGLSLGFSQNSLLKALLFVQIIAFPSSIITGYIADRFQAKRVIFTLIVIYIFITLGGGILMKKASHFTNFAIITGIVQGGIQALSRSMFSSIIPENHSTELFGIYNMVGRFAGILGPLFFVLAAFLSIKFPTFLNGESTRIGMVSLSSLFILGGIFLLFVREPRER